MSVRNVVQIAIDEFGQAAKCTKKSGSWYLRNPELIFVLNLQKSQYGLTYFLNVAVWLTILGDVEAPKENKCHIRTRVEDLLPLHLGSRISGLLDMQTEIDDLTRHVDLLALLNQFLLPIVQRCSSVNDLRSGIGLQFVNQSLVNGPALKILEQSA